MNNAQFEKKIMGNAVLVDFGASWCGPCQAMEPMIEALEAEFDGRAEIIKIDIDTHRALATEYMVQSIPTLILFQKGREKKRYVGLQDITSIENSIKNLL